MRKEPIVKGLRQRNGKKRSKRQEENRECCFRDCGVPEEKGL